MCFEPYFLRYILSMYTLFYHILHKHRAPKYRGPLTRGMKFLMYAAIGKVPPLSKAKYVSRLTFWDIPLPYILLSYHVGLGTLTRGMAFLGYTVRGQVALLWKVKCVSCTFWDIPPSCILLFYCILSKHQARKYGRPMSRNDWENYYNIRNWGSGSGAFHIQDMIQ
jgi:hypothetical protein